MRRSRVKDLTGLKCKTLTVTGFASFKSGRYRWYCKCSECGQTTTRDSSVLAKGKGTCECKLPKRDLKKKREAELIAQKESADRDLFMTWATRRWV